ncbi:MAG: NTP/NDP exchange transporter [Holosporales bacterium]|jgi:AAA family ATP:ADP antiporter|nr:NTP/NDP exchange transporter [Holosporales bacterium]
MSAKVDQPAQEFSGIRNILWPIHNHEMKKFIPMGLMLMFILFNYTLMRDSKDAFVVKAPGGGAEVLSFLKLGGVLPCAMIFMLIYAKLANVMSSEKIFYVLITFFMAFFVVFGFVLNPLSPILNASPDTIEQWRSVLPKSLYWPIVAVANWTFSLYYVMAELWGSVAIGLLFWQFANATTKISESKRFYGFYGLIGNVGLIASAGCLTVGANIGLSAKATGTTRGYGNGVVENHFFITCCIVAACLIIMYIYSWIHKNVLTDPNLFDQSQIKTKKSKLKLSLSESFKCIFQSSYLGLLLMIVLGYNICMPCVELIWKSQLNIAYPDPNDYLNMMGRLSLCTGAFTILFTIIGMNILRRCSWRLAALITPIMFLSTSAIFFLLLNYTRVAGPFVPVNMWFFSTTVVFVTVYVGLIQNVCSKGTKYSLFDSTKQMAYIPLDPELKSKGQAAVEVVGGRLGKSGGAAIISAMLSFVGGNATLISLTPYVGPFILLIATLWLLSVFGLNKKFLALTNKENE